MENAADALKMAGAVIIFVLALSVIIFYFGEVRLTADTILSYKDRETKYIDGDFYYKTSGTERTVHLETIIPSIFRAYLENYKIVFEGLEEPIYKIKDNNGNFIEKFSLDLETKQHVSDGIYKNVVLANNEQKTEFLCGILNNEFKINRTQFEKIYGITLGNKTLFDQLSRASEIREYLGVYYQNDNPDVPNVMKTEKRIITYKITY